MTKGYFIIIGVLLSICIGLISFSTNKLGKIEKWEMPQVVFPEDNPLSDESIQLGAALFSERLFSKDTSISCQTCHATFMALTDQLEVGKGVFGRQVTRNTPTLNNIGLHPYFMKDGKFKTLEEQVLGPIKDHREFDITPDVLLKRLKTVGYLQTMSQAAYDSELTVEIIQKAIANFERILIAKDTPFDAYMQGDKSAISESAINGYKLFISDELNCVKCHSGFDFSNYSFQNNGTYKFYVDSGRALITKSKVDIGKFKVPSLRNIDLTFPYMHNGSFKSLEDVIKNYESGGKGSKTQSNLIKGFKLTLKERQNLLDFLSVLTEYRYLEMNKD
jgi:cytochrome c peroxidase